MQTSGRLGRCPSQEEGSGQDSSEEDIKGHEESQEDSSEEEVKAKMAKMYASRRRPGLRRA